MTRSLDVVVIDVAKQLMSATAITAPQISQRILAELVAHFDVDVSFLRHNDHRIRATKLVAEWPTRHDVPYPDPLGVIYFDNADPIFALLEHVKEPIVIRPDPVTDEYGRRIERARGIPVTSIAAVGLVSDELTTGALGFIKFDDRAWNDEELNALKAIATIFAQLQGRIAAEERLRHLAEHDDLTGVYTPRALIARLEERLAAGQRGPVWAIHLDLDRLKALNEYLGHTVGDQFLKVVAGRLAALAGESALVARLGGDKFVIVPSAVGDAADAETLAQRLHDGALNPVRLEGELLRRTASIGIASATPGLDSVSDLLQRAEEAVVSAKAAGGNQITGFCEQSALRSALRSDVQLHLHDAIENDDLILQYLPEVHLRTGEVLAVEALVRWLHPSRGLLMPIDFIGIAESVNLAGEVSRWVLHRACAQFTSWRSRGVGTNSLLRVNVSPAQVVTADFAATVAGVLDEFGLPPGSVCLEITESVVVQDIEGARKALADLHDVGVKVAIDDFGTGYSALAHLKELPIDTIKIDRGFVRDLGVSPGDLAIVQSIIGLADAFDLEVVAEGVETQAAARQLLRCGCHRAQGFLVSRPISSEATESLLSAGRIPLMVNDGDHTGVDRPGRDGSD